MDANSTPNITDQEYFTIVRNSKLIHVDFNQLLRERLVIDGTIEDNTDINGDDKRNNEPESGS